MPVISGGTILQGDGFPQDPLTGAGAPAANYMAGVVRVGAQYINATTGVVYVCTATNGTSTATWTVLGPGAGP
jgi:hypothetical protein